MTSRSNRQSQSVFRLLGSLMLLVPWMGAVQAGEVRTAGDSLSHFSGYAFATYLSVGNEDAVSMVGVNPIFHFQHGDQVLFEGELEIATTPEGETETALEYATIDFLLHDNLVVVMGKFLGPVGYFVPNLHPAWINRLPEAPLGFGHAGAAPGSDVGLQARGGIALGEEMRLNYMLYLANGPELAAEAGEIEEIATEGFTRDVDGSKVGGGRVGVLPFPALEIGGSYSSGRTSVTTDGGVEVTGDPDRSYEAYGADLAWRFFRDFQVRGEFIGQKVGDAPASPVAPDGGKWEAWYGQAAWQIVGGPFEVVARYGEVETPHNPGGLKQTAAGLNYYVAPNAQIKLGYAWMSGAPFHMLTTDDRATMQFAYGF